MQAYTVGDARTSWLRAHGFDTRSEPSFTVNCLFAAQWRQCGLGVEARICDREWMLWAAKACTVAFEAKLAERWDESLRTPDGDYFKNLRLETPLRVGRCLGLTI